MTDQDQTVTGQSERRPSHLSNRQVPNPIDHRPSVSVAMATYNGERFIAAQLGSLLEQTHPPCEIVVCDDQSADGTVGIVREIAARSAIPIVVHVNEARLGYRANFMHAASLCSGDLVSFCDQDDIWYPEKLTTVVSAFTSRDVLLVHHNARLVDQDGKNLGHFLHNPDDPTHTSKPLQNSPWQFPLGFTQTFRRMLLQFAPLREMTEDPYDSFEKLAHDQWIPLMAGALGQRVYIGAVLTDYRQHGGNLFGRKAVPQTKLSAIKQRLLKYSDYEQLAHVSDRIANMFGSISNGSTEVAVSRFELACRQFSRLAENYRLRARVYNDKTFSVRCFTWCRMAASSCYAKNQSVAFRHKAIVRDFLLGVVLRRASEPGRRGAHFTDHDDSLEFGESRVLP